MKNRFGLVVGLLIAVLVALTGVAVYALVLLGSGLLAAVVAVGGVAAVVAVAAAYAMAREVESQLPDFTPEPPQPACALRKHGFQVREARPGEIPAPYLAAVLKGAQATHAALKARDRQH